MEGNDSSRLFFHGCAPKMLIACPRCRTSYPIAKAILGPHGRRVSCPRCNAVWFARPQMPNMTERPAAALTAMRISAPDTAPAHTLYARAYAARSPAAAPPAAGFAHKFLAGAALMALAMGLIAAREPVARLWPPAGRIYAALGMPTEAASLKFEHFHTLMTRVGGAPSLGIEGEIINLRPAATRVPPVRLAIRDAQGHALYTWTVTPKSENLAPGARLLFRARLADPPQDGRDVTARFAPTAEMIAAR